MQLGETCCAIDRHHGTLSLYLLLVNWFNTNGLQRRPRLLVVFLSLLTSNFIDPHHALFRPGHLLWFYAQPERFGFVQTPLYKRRYFARSITVSVIINSVRSIPFVVGIHSS